MIRPESLTRRHFIKTTTVAATATLCGAVAIEAEEKRRTMRQGLVDVNVTLGHWPFRRVPLDETKALVAKLHQRGVTQAWAGSFDGVFHKDLAAVNTRLAGECREHGRGLLNPFGTVNPALPGWKDELRRCAVSHQMRGIRLFPSYHRYGFDNAAFLHLLALASEHNLIVQIVADLEDERTQSPLARAQHADWSLLPEVLTKAKSARMVALNWNRSVNDSQIQQLAKAGACFDIAMLEGVGGVAQLISQISSRQVLFGSHSPLFYFASAELKLVESALNHEDEFAVRCRNARRLWEASGRAP